MPLKQSDQDKILLKLLSASVHPAGEYFQPATEQLQWKKLYVRSFHLGVNSQIKDWLSSAKHSDPIPENFNKAIHSAKIMANLRNAQLMLNYKQISTAYKQAGIQVAPIKGMWILQQKKMTCEDRISSDMDLLLAECDLKRAAEILSTLGYKQDPAKSRRSALKPSSGGHHITPFRKGGIAVELHYKVYPGSSQFLNHRILKYNHIEDHYMVILCHFIRHLSRGDFKLKWLSDLMHILVDSGISLDFKNLEDPDSLNLPAEACQLNNILLDWRNSPIPETYLDNLSELLERTFDSNKTGIVKWQDYLPRTKESTLNLIETIFPSKEYLRFIHPKLNKTPIILLYLFRLTKLVYKAFLSKLAIK